MSNGSDSGQQRRHSDLRLIRRLGRWLVGEPNPRENRYRDLILVVAIGIALAGVWIAHTATGTAGRATNTAERATHEAGVTLGHVQEGRATAITITCAVVSAVSEAGRSVIAGPPVRESRFLRNLERLGYPPPAVRRAQARQAAAGYVRDIDRRVARELGQLGRKVPKGLIRKDGAIDCQTLQRVSALPKTR